LRKTLADGRLFHLLSASAPSLYTGAYMMRVLVGTTLLFCVAAFPQTAFEVASIRPADPDHSMSISRSGNRLYLFELFARDADLMGL
jgi:hypothetical protein